MNHNSPLPPTDSGFASLCNITTDPCFSRLGSPRRIWAVSAIHADTERLANIHEQLFPLLRPGDRIVYHGNYTGFGKRAVETIDELLMFRRGVLARPGMMVQDFAYLRGGQEEMWEKLLQLPFCPNPAETLYWMLDHGLTGTLISYGISPNEGVTACREGVMALVKWTGRVREAIRRHAGHEVFQNQIKRAALTAQESPYPMLFVHAGLDPDKTLAEQRDNFWWGAGRFKRITLAYAPFQKVVRGFDPNHNGLHLNCVTATIDGGCGFGGHLVAAGFGADGTVEEMIEA